MMGAFILQFLVMPRTFLPKIFVMTSFRSRQPGFGRRPSLLRDMAVPCPTIEFAVPFDQFFAKRVDLGGLPRSVRLRASETASKIFHVR
jgi:hypothetical protein